MSGLSYNVTLYGLVIFICRSVLQPHDVTFFGLLGASPPDPTGALPLDPLGDFRPPDSLPVPLPNQYPKSAL